MRQFLFIILLFASFSGFAQTDTIAYSHDYEFKEGIYLTVKQFLGNQPLTKEKIVTAGPKNQLDFFSQLLDQKRRRDSSAAGLKETLEKIQEYGCVVKDLDIGLLDFPTLYRGEEVYLCWKLGEKGIGYWHGVHEGFRGRKAIDSEFLANHRGE